MIRIEIKGVDFPISPRKDNPGDRMVCFHTRHLLGDDHDYNQRSFRGWDHLKDQLIKDGAEVILPVYLYDHSGLSLSTVPFSCSWDSGQVGFIYTTKEDMKPYGGSTVNAETRMKDSVEKYSHYLNGDIYDITVKKGTPVIIKCPHCNDPTGEEIKWEDVESFIEYGYGNHLEKVIELLEQYPNADIVNMI